MVKCAFITNLSPILGLFLGQQNDDKTAKQV
jgi:hypothetical protein